MLTAVNTILYILVLRMNIKLELKAAVQTSPSECKYLDSCMQKSKSTALSEEVCGALCKQMSSIGCCAGNKHALLLVSAPCKIPFAAARRPPKPRIGSCRAEEGANKKQNVKDQFGEDVMRRLKEAEEEANALRKQLAEAKEKAQVNGMQGQEFPPLTALRAVHSCNSLKNNTKR